MDIINPPKGALWGKYNNRPISYPWIKSLFKTFMSSMDNCSDNNSLDITIDPD